jgi:hypothetical protein
MRVTRHELHIVGTLSPAGYHPIDARVRQLAEVSRVPTRAGTRSDNGCRAMLMRNPDRADGHLNGAAPDGNW